MKISPEELLLYASGELPPDRAARVEEALRSDPEARRALAELRDQEAQLARLPILEPGRDLVGPALAAARRPRLLSFPAPLLAAAAVLLALGGLLWALWLRKPAVQVARDAPPPAGLVSDDELAARLAGIRMALGGMTSPGSVPSPEPEGAFAADVRERLETLQGLCRSPVAASRSERPGAVLDRRMWQLKSRMNATREDLLKIEAPDDDEIARQGAPTAHRNTTISISFRGFQPSKEPAVKPVDLERSPS